MKNKYEKLDTWLSGKNKPNSNPNKPNLRKAQMNVNSLITKDCRKKDDFIVRINKPNSNPISSKAKMSANAFSQKDYENKTAFRLQKNKPNSNPIQTQNKACPERSEFTLSVIEGNGPILKRMNLTFVLKGIMRANPHSQQIIQSSISPLPGVVVRESSHQADKIALKIYPFGIDCPIVCEERLFTIYRKDYD